MEKCVPPTSNKLTVNPNLVFLTQLSLSLSQPSMAENCAPFFSTDQEIQDPLSHLTPSLKTTDLKITLCYVCYIIYETNPVGSWRSRRCGGRREIRSREREIRTMMGDSESLDRVRDLPWCVWLASATGMMLLFCGLGLDDEVAVDLGFEVRGEVIVVSWSPIIWE